MELEARLRAKLKPTIVLHSRLYTISKNCRTICVWDSRFEESDIEYIEVTEPVYSVLLIRRRRSYNESGNDNK